MHVCAHAARTVRPQPGVRTQKTTYVSAVHSHVKRTVDDKRSHRRADHVAVSALEARQQNAHIHTRHAPQLPCRVWAMIHAHSTVWLTREGQGDACGMRDSPTRLTIHVQVWTSGESNERQRLRW